MHISYLHVCKLEVYNITNKASDMLHIKLLTNQSIKQSLNHVGTYAPAGFSQPNKVLSTSLCRLPLWLKSSK